MILAISHDGTKIRPKMEFMFVAVGSGDVNVFDWQLARSRHAKWMVGYILLTNYETPGTSALM